MTQTNLAEADVPDEQLNRAIEEDARVRERGLVINLFGQATFEADGAATRIEMRTVFPTKELRDEAVEKYHAIEGGQQTLSKLAAYVTEIVRKGG